jgi:ribosome biogenesis protein Nip4
MFKVLYEKYYSNIDNLSVKHFKNNYKKILDNLYRIAYRDFESEYKLKNIIDFNLYTSDYFFNTNIVREFQEMKEKMINKIKQLKETKIYTIESDEEFWYLTGTIIAYITNLSKSNNSTLRLRINYCNINNKNQILNKLTMDFKRYCYDLDVNSRCTKIFSSILNYGDNVNKINKLKFQQGLFETDSIMYTKLEENKLNEKEGEM